MICINCKAQLEEGTVFCTECGCRQFPAVAAPTPAAGYDDETVAFRSHADLDATQIADLDATQMADFDATQAAPYAAMQSEAPAAPPPASYDSYSPPYYADLQPPANPSGNSGGSKNYKTVIGIIVAAAAVLIAVLGILAVKFLPETGLFEKDTTVQSDGKRKDDEATAQKEESTTAPRLEVTAPELVQPELTSPALEEFTVQAIFPTVPYGSDTANIGGFNPGSGSNTPATAATKPAAPQTTRRQEPTTAYSYGYEAATNYYEEPTTEYYEDELMEAPYATVYTGASQAHIGGYFYDYDGSSTYVEYGYFENGDCTCLYQAAEGIEFILEIDSDGYIAPYYRENGSGYFIELADVDTSACYELANNIISIFTFLGYDFNETYPEVTYDYLGDYNWKGNGDVERYYMYDYDGSYMGEVFIDENTGYFARIYGENGDLIFEADFIDMTGAYLPTDY